MKRIITILILSIAVFVGTIVFTNTYVSNKSTETANYFNNIALENFRSEMNGDIHMTELAARNFMVGVKNISINDSNMLIVDEQHLNGVKKGIYNNLIQFMRANPYYESAMIIVDEEVNRQYFDGKGCFAPAVNHGDTTHYDLAANYDFMKSAHYQKVKKERTKLWSVPLPTSPVAGKYMTLYTPIILSDGRFFGAFAISLNINTINNKIQKHLPYGEEFSGMFIADEEGNIFSAYPTWILEYSDLDDLETNLESRLQQGEMDDHVVISSNGDEYYIYQRKTTLVPWRIFTICQKNAIYEEATQLKHVIYSTSVMGMILMLICCIVISQQIRRDFRRKAAVEEELKMASKVQMSLLKPTSFISHPSPLNPSQDKSSPLNPQPSSQNITDINLSAYIQPAKETGGDLYDYVEKDGNLIFCIGDVSGKGMPAALFMTQVISLFRNAVRSTNDPAEITSQINDTLAHDNPDMTFCTLFVGVLSDTALSFCNAGHNRPVVKTGTEVHFMKIRPNLAVGLMEGYPYKAEDIVLSAPASFPATASTTMLFLYTDGITEAKNKQHTDYGEQHLIYTLSKTTPDNCINAVLNDINAFVGQNEQSDDITMLCIKIEQTMSSNC